ncbi:hypothetical protein B0O80DRAFT_505213 [Mortierella sp. GBAus27b]|nr:hypothetical protein B0O80DRAFT_505213 [Mortierella sp. GBAus27b]
MGLFVPSCITQGGKSLYAFTTTSAYSDRTSTKVYMLVKSNENPSYTLEDLTWTPMSVIPTVGYTEIKYSEALRDHNCAFDVDTGVFTLFHQAYNGNFSYPAGMQYIPSDASGGGSSQPSTNALFGSGTWRNVTFPPDYKWLASRPNRLFNYKDSQSKTHLMHVYNNVTEVYVATLDPTTMIMNQGPAWNTMLPGFSAKSINVDSQNIYILGSNQTLWDTATLHQFPINSTNPTVLPQPSLRTFNGTTSQCTGFADSYYLFNLRGNPLMVCEGGLDHTTTPVTLLNGTELTMLTGIIGGAQGTKATVFEVVDVPSIPYLIYQGQDKQHTFFSAALSGPSAGAKVYAKTNMTVAENYGDYPSTVTNGPNGPLTDWGSGLGGSKNSAGAIAGGVCAVVVVVIAVLGFLYYRRRRRQQQGNHRQGLVKATPNGFDSSLPTAPGAGAAQSLDQKPMQQVQPLPPLQSLQVYDQDQVELKHNHDHGGNGVATQYPVTPSTPTHSALQPGYSSNSPTSVPAPTVPVHTRPLTVQHGFP